MVRTEQYTSGGEFKLPDGTNYVGAYHVHITKGAMVGAYHKDTPHDRLIPSDRQSELLLESIINQLNLQQSTPARRSTATGSRPTRRSSGGGGGY
mgnify:FL=1|tara:strand:- start:561 stop:845 length:285 start_codon:yes stop_codon:yes gene_type:complete